MRGKTAPAEATSVGRGAARIVATGRAAAPARPEEAPAVILAQTAVAAVVAARTVELPVAPAPVRPAHG